MNDLIFMPKKATVGFYNSLIETLDALASADADVAACIRITVRSLRATVADIEAGHLDISKLSAQLAARPKSPNQLPSS